MDDNIGQGSCYCQAIQFEFQLPVREVFHCHCNTCRRLSGADYTTWVVIPVEKFRLLSGVDKMAEFDINENSSKYFCSKCGISVYVKDSRYPGVYGVLRGTIDCQELPKPTSHCFVDHKASWVTIKDDLPQFGGNTGFEPKSKED